jgi:hypothetical protein
MAIDCTARWGTLIPSGEVNLSIIQAVFGFDAPASYDEWQVYPHCLAICQKHYRQLRRSDGYTLGYRYQNGKTVAFVKTEHF